MSKIQEVTGDVDVIGQPVAILVGGVGNQTPTFHSRRFVVEGGRLLDNDGQLISTLATKSFDEPQTSPEVVIGLVNYLTMVAGVASERIALNAKLRIIDGVIWHGDSPLCAFEDGRWQSFARPGVTASELHIG